MPEKRDNTETISMATNLNIFPRLEKPIYTPARPFFQQYAFNAPDPFATEGILYFSIFNKKGDKKGEHSVLHVPLAIRALGQGVLHEIAAMLALDLHDFLDDDFPLDLVHE